MSFIKPVESISDMSINEIRNLENPFKIKKKVKDNPDPEPKPKCKKCADSGFFLCKTWKHEKPCNKCDKYLILKAEGKVKEFSS
jgi:hypothetical protein